MKHDYRLSSLAAFAVFCLTAPATAADNVELPRTEQKPEGFIGLGRSIPTGAKFGTVECRKIRLSRARGGACRQPADSMGHSPRRIRALFQILFSEGGQKCAA
jgi:hypothetical protein